MAENLVMEEREEYMVAPRGGTHVCHRKAHFLKPSVTCIDGPVVAPSLSCSAPRLAEYKDLPLKVNYHGWWKHPPESWKTWVNQMHPVHHSTWKKAGILDAVMSSTCIIHKYDDLILGFVEKWCPTTNSFVFPWGEATVTLEDVMVLGGYSIMGSSALIPPGNEEILEKLMRARSSIIHSKARKADQSKWIARFVGSGDEIEHESFLAYWLSRFVFPLCPKTIGSRSILSLAVQLGRGTQIALAPAVLAIIYKNLTHLKASITAARKSVTKEGGNGGVEFTVSAQLSLVQAWIWERFPALRPKPNSVERNEPRLARWHNLKLGLDYRLLTINSAGKDFQWRPYITRNSNVFSGKFYMENECLAKVDCNLDEDLEGFVRCLRPSELVSLENCIEQYLPHRVAMQFGIDQDLPGHVARVNVNPDIAWRDYTRPISDLKLYVPPCLFEPCVTTRYSRWWKKLNLGWNSIDDVGADGKTPCVDSKVEVKKYSFQVKSEGDPVPPPPGFSPKGKRVEETGSSGIVGQLEDEQAVQRQSPLCFSDNNDAGKGSSKSSKRAREPFEISDYYGSINPPGFSAKKQVKSSSYSTSRIEKEEALLSRSDDAQVDEHLSSKANNENSQVEMLFVEPVESEAECTLTSEVHRSRLETPGVEIEEKIRIIEKLCALIKAGKITLPWVKNYYST